MECNSIADLNMHISITLPSKWRAKASLVGNSYTYGSNRRCYGFQPSGASMNLRQWREVIVLQTLSDVHIKRIQPGADNPICVTSSQEGEETRLLCSVINNLQWMSALGQKLHSGVIGQVSAKNQSPCHHLRGSSLSPDAMWHFSFKIVMLIYA